MRTPLAVEPAKNKVPADTDAPLTGSATPLCASATSAPSLITAAWRPTSSPSATSSSRTAWTARWSAMSAIAGDPVCGRLLIVARLLGRFSEHRPAAHAGTDRSEPLKRRALAAGGRWSRLTGLWAVLDVFDH